MMNRSAGGREIYRGDYTPRTEDISRNRPPRKGEAPPSRHLWVGNLPPRVTQGMLLEHFNRFGNLENIVFVPGRSYAFVNFRRVEEAVFALRSLQGQMFAGLPLKIEFQKLDKVSANSSLDEEYVRDERSFSDHGEFYRSPRKTFTDNSRLNTVEEPSEILRIDFPPQLNIDRLHLERAFSPFGLLDKVLIFPSEGYAIVRFRSIAVACLAKDALRGKLFNDPRVTISFARRDRDFDHPPSSRFFPGVENFPGEVGFAGSFDLQRFQRAGVDRRLSEDRVDFRVSPSVDISTHPVLWKKAKTESFSDRELPDYPFSNFEKEVIPRLPERQNYNRSLITDFGGKEIPDSTKFDGFGSTSLNSRTNLEKFNKPLHDWKWEGTIAKGGTPICRARCFPVGNPLDFMLPEFLDCTARTGLDMLSQHFYQASCSWVVFFVPETDADINFYNEFLLFLKEKNRAAVAKLEDKTTLFLVPPSDFSEKVLKVPGKMSISGVILRFQFPEKIGSTGTVDESTLSDPYAQVSRPSYSGPLGQRISDRVLKPAEETLPSKKKSSEAGVDFSSATQVKPPLMPEQLAQLASFLGQRKQLGKSPEIPVSFSNQVQQGTAPETVKFEHLARGGSQENEPDPQKRLQATLQLAASLLQQIQQQAKPEGS